VVTKNKGNSWYFRIPGIQLIWIPHTYLFDPKSFFINSVGSASRVWDPIKSTLTQNKGHLACCGETCEIHLKNIERSYKRTLSSSSNISPSVRSTWITFIRTCYLSKKYFRRKLVWFGRKQDFQTNPWISASPHLQKMLMNTRGRPQITGKEGMG
jgi:hypothetical protein